MLLAVAIARRRRESLRREGFGDSMVLVSDVLCWGRLAGLLQSRGRGSSDSVLASAAFKYNCSSTAAAYASRRSWSCRGGAAAEKAGFFAVTASARRSVER